MCVASRTFFIFFPQIKKDGKACKEEKKHRNK